MHPVSIEQLQHLLTAIPGVVYQFRASREEGGRFLYLSPGLTGLFEVTPEEAYADYRLLMHCILEEDRAAHFASVGSAFAKLDAWSHNYRILTKSGRLKWIRGQALPLLQSDGSVLWNGILVDITEHKGVEAALLANQQRLQDLLNFLPDAMLAIDRDKRVIIWNQAIEQMTGVPAAQMLGRGDYAYTLPFYGEARSQLMDLVFLDDAEVASLYPHIRREGESLIAEVFCNALYRNRGAWVVAKASPLHDPSGQVIGAIEIIRDVTSQKKAELARRQSQEILDLFLRHSPVYAYVKRVTPTESRVVKASDNFHRMIGAAECDMEGKTMAELFPAEFAARVAADDWRVVANAEVLCQEETFKDRHYTSIRFPIVQDGQTLLGGYTIDITERKLAERQLQESEERHRLFFEQSRDAMMTLTPPSWRFASGNDAACQLFGIQDRAEFVRLGAWDLSPEFQPDGRRSDEKIHEVIETALSEGAYDFEWMYRRTDGTQFPATVLLTRMTIGGEVFLQGIVRDITAFKEQERRLEQIAHYDALTALPNRILLAERLQQGMAESRRCGRQLAVVYLDLDGFKTINDGYGHAVGDRFLRVIAERMRQTLRQGDTLARLGGDEFVAVLLDLDAPAASKALLRRLLAAAAEPLLVGDLLIQVSASAGVTLYPQAETVDGDQLLRQADQAMYQAKLTGKNRYHFFDAEYDRSARGFHESLEHIRAALAADEFVLHYQPKVNLRTGDVVGLEALIRWQHPERGLLAPGIFLPVVEHHPLAIKLGEWVIDRALTQMDLWREEGLDLPVSVNVGARQLQQADFVQRLRRQLMEHPRIPPGRLELELLETTALEDLSHVSQVIADCDALGIRCALDDFGTGYSSLAYLKRLSVGQIKIDQSFVREMLENTEELAIVESILSLAAVFRREVIAEGVETVAHGTVLQMLGGELAQGYGIARPMPAHEVVRWCRDWTPDPRWSGLGAVGREERSLVYAGVDHNAWVVAVEQSLRGVRDVRPSMDPYQCRFGRWLAAEGQAECCDPGSGRRLETLHRRIHALAEELLELKDQGQHARGIGRLNELHGLRDMLLQALESGFRTARVRDGASRRSSENHARDRDEIGDP
ncbi:EAL domain-containing protein [Imhoffiella purpurea]|nr:EAL domain-containing protein [Imhoffiella purpurea]